MYLKDVTISLAFEIIIITEEYMYDFPIYIHIQNGPF